MHDKLEKAISSIRKKSALTPKVAVILGSGLGFLADEINAEADIPYSQIEGFPLPSIPGHCGRLVLGNFAQMPVAMMSGRVHFYEGFTPQEVIFPTRTLRLLGAQYLIITNAAGGICPQFQVGDLMLITDHINYMGFNPLIGHNCDAWGERFPDMSTAYDPQLQQIAHLAAQKIKTKLHQGVYLATSGPSYETPAEIRMFAQLGADAVGMSTVPEVIAARHMKMRILGISCIANPAAGTAPGQKLSHDDITIAVERNRYSFAQLMREILSQIAALPAAD